MQKKQVKDIAVGDILDDLLAVRAERFPDTELGADDLFLHLLDFFVDQLQIGSIHHIDGHVVLVDGISGNPIRQPDLADHV